MLSTAIIFGGSGQDGVYLGSLLTARGVEVVSVSRSGKVAGDVADYSFVESLIRIHRPSYIFHLAADSTTAHGALFPNHASIGTGTLNILEASRLHCPGASIFLSGSAMQFSNSGKPINEDTPFAALSPYAVSRIQSVYAGRYYRNSFGMRVYVGYFFNHDSPLRTERHVNQKIAKAIQRIAGGSREFLELGNLDTRKEFNFAGDVIDAVWILVNQEALFETVIGSGIAYSIRDWLQACSEQMGVNWRDFVIAKRDFVPEYDILVSDPRLIKGLGWNPQVSFCDLASMMTSS